ncbi:hypothetical protein D3C74_452570 [compost metagenome]
MQFQTPGQPGVQLRALLGESVDGRPRRIHGQQQAIGDGVAGGEDLVQGTQFQIN